MCTSIVHDFCSRVRTTRELFFSKASSLISSAILSDFNESSSSSCLLRLVYLGVCLTENIEYQCSYSPPSLCLHASLRREKGSSGFREKRLHKVFMPLTSPRCRYFQLRERERVNKLMEMRNACLCHRCFNSKKN